MAEGDTIRMTTCPQCGRACQVYAGKFFHDEAYCSRCGHIFDVPHEKIRLMPRSEAQLALGLIGRRLK